MSGCNEDGTLAHELLLCDKNDGVGHKLLGYLQLHAPGLHADAALRLDHGDIENDKSLPLTLLTAIILSTVWKEREAGAAIKSYKVRAELEQSINLLRTTRLNNITNQLTDMMHLMF